MKYIVGVAQFEPQLLQVQKNLEQMGKMLQNIEADLVVFPELASSGYVFGSKAEVEQVAEDAQSGPTASYFRQLAQQHNCSLVVGFPEKSGNKIYNSSLLVNPNGEIFVYRKLHLFYEEKQFFSPGDKGFLVFPAKAGVKIGMMVCFDWIFPESARTLALLGAQIIAHPANLVLPWCQQAMITRSLENRVFSITANRTGTESNGQRQQIFTGLSQILSPKGEIYCRLNETENKITTAEIDPNQANDKAVTEFNDAFGDRRPEFYL
ncbi:MAG: nitrilase-related carbon-nitrogen hydrolase [Candidatus Cloacimonadales bacterium]